MFLLVIIFQTGYGSYPFPVFQEFETIERCEGVKNSITASWKKSGYESRLLTAYCTKK